MHSYVKTGLILVFKCITDGAVASATHHHDNTPSLVNLRSSSSLHVRKHLSVSCCAEGRHSPEEEELTEKPFLLPVSTGVFLSFSCCRRRRGCSAYTSVHLKNPFLERDSVIFTGPPPADGLLLCCKKTH